MSSLMDTETRFLGSSELRAIETGGVPHIIGYAALFNVWSLDLGGFIETVLPGAFTKSLQTADVRALSNHEEERILGRTAAGTLSLVEDDIGLKVDIIPPDTTYARDLLTSIARGDISQMSFQFKTILDDVRFDGGVVRRWLKEVELIDVAPVTFPAYPQTTVALRSRVDAAKSTATAGILENVSDVALNAERLARFDIMRKRLDLAALS